MKLEDFNYVLPKELIAQQPAEPRDSCRLLMVDKKTGEWQHRRFRDILDEIRPGDVFVFNNTKVIPARLFGRRKETGGKVEALLLTPKGNDVWEILVNPGRKALPGQEIEFSENFSCTVIDKTEFGGRLVKFHYSGDFDNWLDQLGEMPTPPYIHKKLENKDEYQTVYAKFKGSAAAPTAGLHFTQEQLDKLADKGVKEAYITLHVGLGTFCPVKAADITEHHMHSEFCMISRETADIINETKRAGGRIVCVGTTSCRTLESLADENGYFHEASAWTDIFIYPGYKFKAMDALITNFHLPESTLVMLVSAFADREKILNAYNIAVQERYRFFSFGDAMFIS